ncbi:MAG: hypothetical protein JNM36_04140 [Chitinophagales bacterium]|nr:hypothetical protein [Chitinophagales bacterium]
MQNTIKYLLLLFLVAMLWGCNKMTFEDCQYHTAVVSKQLVPIYLKSPSENPSFFALLYKKDTIRNRIWEDRYKGYDFQGIKSLDKAVVDPICRGYNSIEHIPYVQCIWQDTLDNNSEYQHRLALANQQSDSLINQLLVEYDFRRLPHTQAEWAGLLHLVKIVQIPPYVTYDFLLKIASTDSLWQSVEKSLSKHPDTLKNPYQDFNYCCYKKAYAIVHTPLSENSRYIAIIPKEIFERGYSFSWRFFRVDFYLSSNGYLQVRKILLNPAELDSNYMRY